MIRDRAARMRAYWDERARVNAAWYVDTTLDFEHPDMDRFFASGERIVDDHYVGGLTTPPRHELAVEIGAGLGRICRALKAHFDHVVGVDIAPEMVAQAREMVTVDGVEFRVGDGTTLTGVGDATADLVFTFTVFQHIPDPQVVEGYIAEAGRVLRPGGVFVFQWNNEPNAWWWSLRRSVLGWLQRTGRRREAFDRHAPEFLGCRISTPRIRRALADAGLDLVGTRGDGTLFTWAWAVRPDTS